MNEIREALMNVGGFRIACICAGLLVVGFVLLRDRSDWSRPIRFAFEIIMILLGIGLAIPDGFGDYWGRCVEYGFVAVDGEA